MLFEIFRFAISTYLTAYTFVVASREFHCNNRDTRYFCDINNSTYPRYMPSFGFLRFLWCTGFIYNWLFFRRLFYFIFIFSVSHSIFHDPYIRVPRVCYPRARRNTAIHCTAQHRFHSVFSIRYRCQGVRPASTSGYIITQCNEWNPFYSVFFLLPFVLPHSSTASSTRITRRHAVLPSRLASRRTNFAWDSTSAFLRLSRTLARTGQSRLPCLFLEPIKAHSRLEC